MQQRGSCCASRASVQLLLDIDGVVGSKEEEERGEAGKLAWKEIWGGPSKG